MCLKVLIFSEKKIQSSASNNEFLSQIPIFRKLLKTLLKRTRKLHIVYKLQNVFNLWSLHSLQNLASR